MARYEITGPDGAKYEITAPDDATEEQVLEYAKGQFKAPQKQETFGDRLASALGLPPLTPERQAVMNDMMARPWGSGVPQFAYDVGGKVTDVATNVGASPEVAAGAGVTANVLTQAIPSMLASGRMMDAKSVSLLETPAKKLMQSAVKPSIADLKSGDAGRAMTTMLDEGIYPTRSGMEKASNLAGKLEKQVEQAIAQSPARVSVAAAASKLRDPYNKALKQVNPQEDLNAIRGVWDKFRTSPLVAGKTDIPVQLAQELKQGTYRSIGGKAYGEIGSASVEAQKALARGLREEVAKAVPSITTPLAREASLMNVMDVAGNRALMEANKNPLGLAALRMDNPASAATFLADRWAALKAFLAMQAYGAGKPQVLGPLGTAAGTAMNNRPALYQED